MQFPENRLRLSAKAMVKCGGCIAILLGVYAGYGIGYRAYSRAIESQVSWHAAQAINAKSWRRIMPIMAADRNAKAVGTSPFIAFSPVDFQREGARLMSWVPSDTGGEMSLEIPWQQVPATFSMLAERGMQVIAFTLRAENGVLRFILQLVHNDEP